MGVSVGSRGCGASTGSGRVGRFVGIGCSPLLRCRTSARRMLRSGPPNVDASEFPCPPWLLDKLAAVGADAAEMEDDEREEEGVE